MDISHRSVGSGATERTPELTPESAAYLTHLAREQDRFLASVAEAGAHVGEGAGQLGKVVAIQNRLTQEFLDAQRSIIRRRAETEAAVVQIECAAACDAQQLAAFVHSCGSAWPAPSLTPSAALSEPTGWSAPGPRGSVPSLELASVDPVSERQINDADMASIARLVDGAFDRREPDGDVMRRQLREVLDGWWMAEQQEAKAAVDDATARAAMRVHLARVEADLRSADQVRAEFASPTYRYEPPRQVSPLITALDTTTHEGLDDVLASLLDGLDGTSVADVLLEPSPAAQRAIAQPGPGLTTRSPMPRVATLIPDPIPTPVLPPPAGSHVKVDSLTDETAAPQEAFDRFWGLRSARSADGRDWVFPQLLLPAVAVIAVLALVLAVVG
jgi:hypothetical protein